MKKAVKMKMMADAGRKRRRDREKDYTPYDRRYYNERFELEDKEDYSVYPPMYHQRHREGKEAGVHYTSGAHKENHHPKTLDKETAEKWVSQMSKPDKKGEKGGKWTYEETAQILKERELNVDPVLFFVAMNMMFSDYGKTLAKHNVNSVNLYIDLAMDWIEDDDVAAGKEKTTDYYYCVVK